MAQDKGKNIVTGPTPAPAPPMNPPPGLFPVPFGKRHGCDGDGCASDPDTWPLHDVIRRGVHCRLCSSCIILSHRSLYCCRCFFLVTSPSSNYDDGDTLMAPPAPTMTCQYCCQAIAHVPCLYPEVPADGAFLCPPCTAALNGRPFTYAPPCRQPIDDRGARVLVIAARIALALLKRHAAAAREAAERKAREARDARARANEALSIAYDLAKKEDPSWVQRQPQLPENDLPASEEGEGIEADEANVGKGKAPLVPCNAMPSLDTLTIGGMGGSVVPMALAEAKHMPSSSQSKPLFDLNEKADDENEEEAVQAEPTPPHRALNSSNVKEAVALNSINVKEMAMAAAEAARAASTSTPQMLQLFPSAKASSSAKMPRSKKPRTKRPRTMQLFNNDGKKM